MSFLSSFLMPIAATIWRYFADSPAQIVQKPVPTLLAERRHEPGDLLLFPRRQHPRPMWESYLPEADAVLEAIGWEEPDPEKLALRVIATPKR